MQKWEFEFFAAKVEYEFENTFYRQCNPLRLLETDEENDGKSNWDVINEYGSEGWELVNVTPFINSDTKGSYTSHLVYTFKRRLEE